MGAYLQLVTPGVPILGAFMFNAIYKMDALSFTCHGVFTNKTPTDAYRGAGRPEATYAIERLIDEAANELGVEPFELRERNWIKHEEFPYETIAGITYDSGNYEAATAKAKELFDYDGLRAEQARRREADDPVQLGIGISTFTEMCGLAPSRVLGSLSYGAGGWEHAAVRMLPTGKVEVITGTSPHGQGHVTAWSQIAADQLGVAYEDVEVRHGDTAIAHKGMDTYGSRSLVVGGYAVVAACDKVVAKARKVAAHLLEASRGRPRVRRAARSACGARRTRRTTIQDVALAVFAAHDYPEDMEPSLDSDATVDPENFSYPHGTHLCAVEVDTETGHVAPAQLRRRRRHRQGHQPADRRGPGPRRAGPGHRAGAVRGGGLRRRRQPHHRIDRRLLRAVGGRPADVRDRPDRDAGDVQPARGQGRRRGRARSPRHPAVINAVVDALRPMGVNDVRMPASPRNVWEAMEAPAPVRVAPTGAERRCRSDPRDLRLRPGRLGRRGGRRARRAR